MNNKIDANAPAFPLAAPGTDTADALRYEGYSGLTIRAEIASRIMAGFATQTEAEEWSSRAVEYAAAAAVKWANALIAELNK